MLQCDEYQENWDDEQNELDYEMIKDYEEYMLAEEMAYYGSLTKEEYDECLKGWNACD